MSKANQPEQAVIQWDAMSILDILSLTKKEDELNNLNVLAAKVQAGMAGADDFAELERLRSAEFQEGHIRWQAEQMAQYVTSVPKDWFKKGAKVGAFDQAATYLELQPRRFMELWRLLLMNQNQAESVTGN